MNSQRHSGRLDPCAGTVRPAQAGFGLVDIVIAIMLMSILAGMAVIGISSVLPAMKTDKAMQEVVAQLRQARNMALAQRRNIELAFSGTNQVEIIRIEEPDNTPNVISTLTLGNKCEFINPDQIPMDTPDGFGNTAAIDFGDAEKLIFSSEGILVDESGDPVNGTVFVGLPDEPELARAVTVLGSTGRIRGYRWTGSMWTAK
ncbi:MAG: hypothetical protein GXX84_04460 [Acidobacteria bacterium]|nr:hypothetical protein [Acidobacteriota bacterium]